MCCQENMQKLVEEERIKSTEAVAEAVDKEAVKCQVDLVEYCISIISYTTVLLEIFTPIIFYTINICSLLMFSAFTFIFQYVVINCCQLNISLCHGSGIK